jgi:outer membrane protein
MKHKLLFLSLTFMLALAANAQQKLALSLSEAQDYAIQNNKSLKNSRLDLQISELKVKEAIANGLPQVDASVDFTTYFGYEMSFDLNYSSDISSLTSAQLASAAAQTLAMFPNATEADLYNYMAGSTYTGLLSDMLPPTTIKMSNSSTGKVQIGQLIYSGQYWVGIQTAKLGKKIAEQGLENSILDLKETVANTYFIILMTQQTMGILHQNIENLKKIQAHTQRMYDAGIAEQTDVDQISIQVSMLENTERSMRRGLEVSYNLMRFQLGVDYSIDIALTETLDQLLIKVRSENAAENAMVENNPLYKITNTQVDVNEEMVKMQKMAYTPTVTGYYAYNQKFLTTGFDMTPNNVAGVSVSIPVFSSGVRKHQLDQAKLQLEEAKIKKSMVSDQLQMQEKQLKSDLSSAIEDYEAQKANVEVARRAYDNINRKYEQGMVSSLDLTQSNSSYLQAETNFIQSTFTLIKAQIALDKLYNQL